jgi:hypothetical protein
MIRQCGQADVAARNDDLESCLSIDLFDRAVLAFSCRLFLDKRGDVCGDGPTVIQGTRRNYAKIRFHVCSTSPCRRIPSQASPRAIVGKGRVFAFEIVSPPESDDPLNSSNDNRYLTVFFASWPAGVNSAWRA